MLLNMCWRLLCADNHSSCVNSLYQNGRFPWTKEFIFINVKNHLTPFNRAGGPCHSRHLALYFKCDKTLSAKCTFCTSYFTPPTSHVRCVPAISPTWKIMKGVLNLIIVVFVNKTDETLLKTGGV